MTLRDCFWFIAGLLAGGAALFVLRGLLHGGPLRALAAPLRRLIVTVASITLIGTLAVAIYLRGGAPDAISPPANAADTPAAPAMPDSLEALTQKLARRLFTHGGSAGEWQLLARSYQELGQPAEARRVLLFARPPEPATPAGAAAETPRGRISGVIDLALPSKTVVPAQATLFVYAREQGMPGAPLAVLRLPATGWPVSFTLDDTHAMLPARTLSAASRVTLEARVSMNGDALARRGDLVGTLQDVNPHATGNVRIAIDRTIQ